MAPSPIERPVMRLRRRRSSTGLTRGDLTVSIFADKGEGNLWRAEPNEARRVPRETHESRAGRQSPDHLTYGLSPDLSNSHNGQHEWMPTEG